jgi:hypothetical protein
MNRHRVCSYCGQTLLDIRLGVRLPPLKAIFDLIHRGGQDGIPAADLFAVAFDERRWSSKTPKVHVSQINELIDDAGYRIVALGGPYCLVRRP